MTTMGVNKMFKTIKKYAQLLRAIAILAERPYLLRIVENPDQTLTFDFVQDNKVYSFTALHAEGKERMIN